MDTLGRNCCFWNTCFHNVWSVQVLVNAKIWKNIYDFLTKMICSSELLLLLTLFKKCVPLKWIKYVLFNGKRTSKSKSTNAWKPNKQLTGFLRLWQVIERGKKRERAARLCARNPFPFLPKIELIPVGYPCVGWLLLLRRRYTHRCLQIWLPPAASDWIQSWDSAPQNTTRKHKMASCTSAILGLLKTV